MWSLRSVFYVWHHLIYNYIDVTGKFGLKKTVTKVLDYYIFSISYKIILIIIVIIVFDFIVQCNQYYVDAILFIGVFFSLEKKIEVQQKLLI